MTLFHCRLGMLHWDEGFSKPVDQSSAFNDLLGPSMEPAVCGLLMLSNKKPVWKSAVLLGKHDTFTSGKHVREMYTPSNPIFI